MIKAKQSSSQFIIHGLLNCLCEGRISEWGFQTSQKIKNKTKSFSVSCATLKKTVLFFFSPCWTFPAKDFRGSLPANVGGTKCHLLCSIILFVIPFFHSFL